MIPYFNLSLYYSYLTTQFPCMYVLTEIISLAKQNAARFKASIGSANVNVVVPAYSQENFSHSCFGDRPIKAVISFGLFIERHFAFFKFHFFFLPYIYTFFLLYSFFFNIQASVLKPFIRKTLSRKSLSFHGSHCLI